jgi:hypothetical protein
MRIVGASSVVSTVRRQTENDSPASGLPEAQRTALITVEAPRCEERAWPSAHHPSAPFVAHLIATRMQAPQTRERRRAEPDEAIAVYRPMTKPVAQNRVFGTRV